eukprot:7070709-Pyramimonas_sp.AAC.1
MARNFPARTAASRKRKSTLVLQYLLRLARFHTTQIFSNAPLASPILRANSVLGFQSVLNKPQTCTA